MVDPVTTELVRKLLGTAVGQAVKPTVETVRHALARRGIGRTDIITALSTTPTVSSVTSLLRSLPVGLTQRAVNEIISGEQFQAIVQLLISARLTNSPEHYRAKLQESVVQLVISNYNGAHIKVARRYGESLFSLIDEQCASVTSELSKKLSRPSEGSTWAFESLSLHHLRGIEKSLALLVGVSAIPDLDIKSWSRRYSAAFDARHAKIDLPDLTERRRIPREKLYVNPSFIPTSESARKLVNSSVARKTVDSEAISDVQLVRMLNRTAILGDPGAGKSTTAAWLADELRTKLDITPFIITLKNVEFSRGGFDIVTEIVEVLRSIYSCPASAGIVERLLREGNCAVIFDGLDELKNGALRRQAVGLIDTFAETTPFARVVVTSRYVGYRSARLNPEVFDEFRIDKFDRARSNSYVTKWLQAQPDISTRERQELANSFINESSTIEDLIANPLLLAFICILYRGHREIPRKRVELYRACVELVLIKWDRARGITDDRPDIRLYHIVLNAIGYAVVSGEISDGLLTQDRVEKIGVEALLKEAEPDRKTAQIIVDELLIRCRGRGWIFTDVGLDKSGEDLFAFSHTSFAEYFAACYLDRLIESPEELADNLIPQISAGRWEVVAQMCLSLRDKYTIAGSSRAIERIFKFIYSRERQSEDPLTSRAGDSWDISQIVKIENAALVDFAVKASDSLPLGSLTIRNLCELALDHFCSGRSGMMEFLMQNRFRHRRIAIEQIVVSLQESLDKTFKDPVMNWRSQVMRGRTWTAVYFTEIANLPGVGVDKTDVLEVAKSLVIPETGWEVFARQDPMSSALAVQLGRSCLLRDHAKDDEIRSALTLVFEPYGRPNSEIGPRSILDWIVKSFSSVDEYASRRHVIAVLAQLGAGLSRGVFFAERPRAIGLDLAESFDGINSSLIPYWEISQRLAGHKMEAISGWLYLSAGMLELQVDLSVSHHRREVDRRIDDMFQYYKGRQVPGWSNLERWRNGDCSIWIEQVGELSP